jgi:hypothetical protein
LFFALRNFWCSAICSKIDGERRQKVVLEKAKRRFSDRCMIGRAECRAPIERSRKAGTLTESRMQRQSLWQSTQHSPWLEN